MLLFFLLWLVAPLAELGIIIVLCVKNDGYRQKIKELERRHPEGMRVMEEPRPQMMPPAKPQRQTWQSVSDRPPAAGRTPSGMAGSGPAGMPSGMTEYRPVGTEMKNSGRWEDMPGAQPPVSPAGRKGSPDAGESRQTPARPAGNAVGLAAMMTGIVFVVLSGLIFATTTWNILPAFVKVMGVLLFAVCFFIISSVAEHRLHIHRTGNAFYLLGSIFLFLSVLAAGYFRLFGPEFILEGRNRFRVLWVGSLVTEAVLFAGVRRFHDRAYTQICFWGLSVSMAFLAASFPMNRQGFTAIMTAYACLLVMASAILEKSGTVPETLAAGRRFVSAHFYLFGLFTALNGWSEIWDRLLVLPFPMYPWTAAGLFFLTAGTAVMALRSSKRHEKVIFALALMELLHYMAVWGTAGAAHGLSLAVLCTAVCFFAGRKWRPPLHSQTGDIIFTACMTFDTAILFFVGLYGNSVRDAAAAMLAFLLLAAVCSRWGKQYAAVRQTIPFLLLGSVSFLYRIAESLFSPCPGYEWVLWGFLCAAALWDITRRDHFCFPIFLTGTAAQLAYRYLWNDMTVPFFLLLSVYALIKELRMRSVGKAAGRTKTQDPLDVQASGKWSGAGSRGRLYAAGIYLLAGAWLDLYPVLENAFYRLLAADALFLLQAGAALWYGKRVESRQGDRKRYAGKRLLYWDLCGSVLMAATLVGFYLDNHCERWEAVCVFGIYVLFYVGLYRGKRFWPHLLAAVFMLPFVLAAASCWELSDDAFFGGTAAYYLITGIAAKRFFPVLRKDVQAQGGWMLDWHHILAVLVLFPMTEYVDSAWKPAYLLLLGMYFIQYAAVERLKTAACLGTAACLTAAVWLRSYDLWSLTAALAAILLLTAMCDIWSRKYRHLRLLIPFSLLKAVRILYDVWCLSQMPGSSLKFKWIVLLYLAALMVWDVKRQGRFFIPVLFIGAAAHLRFNPYGLAGQVVPFLFVLCAYAFVWGQKGKRAGYPLAGILLLAGTSAQIRQLSDNGVIRAAALNLVLWLQMAAVNAARKQKGGIEDGENAEAGVKTEAGAETETDTGTETGAKFRGVRRGRLLYWDACECALVLLMMGEFYWDARLALWNVFVLLAVFSVSYVWLYMGKRAWPHLLTALSVLPLPLALAVRYGLSETAFYGSAAAFLGAAFCLRFWFPVVKRDESAQGGWLVDWYHILSFFILVLMAARTGRAWQSVYLLLLGVYFWQFSKLPGLRCPALSVSGVFLAAAVWKQPLFVWPWILRTEICMLLSALLICWFGRCFGKTRAVAQLQTAGYTGCLAILCIDACRTGRIEDALMLEGICLGIFVLAQMKRWSLWVKISGFFVIAAALYMTKGFWLSIAWWVYLLVAGLGLILFAAVSEKRKK